VVDGKLRNRTSYIRRGVAYVLLAALLVGCCFSDYSEDVRQMGKLYIDMLIAFEKENQRYPSYNEIDQFRTSLGCVQIASLESEYNCQGKTYKFRGGIDYSSDETVDFDIIRSSTNCGFSFRKTKGGMYVVNETKCRQNECIRLRQ